jgi:nucleoside-diphosphate-sugar epimerase
VQALSVVIAPSASQTDDMADDPRQTAFITGADGFLGAELLKALVAGGHQVFALTPSADTAQHVRRSGATPVIGDLLTPGRWQDEAAADWVFHLPPARAFPRLRTLVAGKRASLTTRARVLMDRNLLEAVSAGSTQRIVYVADIRLYGAVGPHLITEDEEPRSSAVRDWLLPTLDRVDGYVLAGVPIVTALPGLVYGRRGWFREMVMDPILAGRRVLQFGAAGPLVSPIHVHDCVRALMHLGERGERGSRYFLVNSEPARFNTFATTFARIADRPLRVWRLPGLTARLVSRDHLGAYLQSDAAFSNIRLRGTGFRFEHPTLEQGLGQIWKSRDA